VNELRFAAHEYLKGSGSSEITVLVRDDHTFVARADALSLAQDRLHERTTTWDDREAIIFITGGEFTLSNRAFQTPFDYSVDTLSRAWLPSRYPGGATATPVDPEYITYGPKSPPADFHFWGPYPGERIAGLRMLRESGAGTSGSEPQPPIISLSDLRSKIAELRTTLELGADIEGFRECIRGMIAYERFERANRHTEYLTPRRRVGTLASASPAGTAVYRNENPSTYRDPKYHRFWLSGPDVGHFEALVDDDDSDPSNGYYHALASARPIPAGEYHVNYHKQHYLDLPCDFVKDRPYAAWTVTVTAPDRVLHEGFFDPVTVGTTVAADDTNGQLEPASFTGVNGSPATLEAISWQPGAGDSGTVKIEVDPDDALAGHILDFIELDGSVSLSLDVSNATVDAATNTLTWTVTSQPWHNGDRLMLRIRKPQ